MIPSEVKKRKACDACTKAKAKCSPFRSRAGICQRCERLSKECVYGASMRKRGPKTRSRMIQLEQRVDTLMGILSATGAAPELLSKANASASTVPPYNSPGTTHSEHSTSLENTPGAPSTKPSHEPAITDVVEPKAASLNYDPVDTGLLTVDQAAELLDEFRAEYAYSFPFVIVESSLDAITLRQTQPFLFLSVMATMAYRTPNVQRALDEAFRQQVAARIMACSLKGLEVLQGLLIHSAYYHYYYHPGKQQLALTIQMCVAIAQELGLSRKAKSRGFSNAPSVLSAAENRGLLGTYYIAAAFAQAWRKRTTVPYTRAIARACRSFSQQPEYDSDLLIAPLVQSRELICRISDYFSYDDIEESEINGETVLRLSTKNFSTEIKRLRDTMPDSAKANNTVRLSFDMLDVMVFECSIHSTLWRSPSSDEPSKMTNVRISMLQRALSASQTFARSLLATPTSSLNSLTFSIWSDWFYSTLLVMKIIVLQKLGDTGSARISSVPQTVGDLLPQENFGSTTKKLSTMTWSLELSSLSESITSLEELELVSLLEAFIRKLEAIAPQYVVEDPPAPHKPYLMKVATLQGALLDGIKKMAYPSHHDTYIQQSESGTSTSERFANVPPGQQDQQPLDAQFLDPGSVNYQSPFDFAFVDDLAAFGNQPGQQTPADDWLWNIVLNDGNIFTM